MEEQKNEKHLNSEPSVGSVPASDNEPSSEKEQAKKQKNSKLVAWLMVGLLVVITVAVAVVFLTTARGDDTQEAVKQHIDTVTVGMQEGPLGVRYPETSSGTTEIFLISHVFDSLVTYEDQTEIVPLLATSWSNDDELTWRFNIKENVTMHNGEILTPEDIKQSLENPSEAFGSLHASTIDTVEVTGPNEVTITTNEPDTTLINKLAFLPIYDVEAYQTDGSTIGTGPYMYADDASDEVATEENALNPEGEESEAAEEVTKISLEAFNQYHRGEVFVDNLVVKLFAGTEEIVTAFENGEINAGIVDTQLEIIDRLDEDSAKIVKHERHAVHHLVLNSTREDSPLQDVQVREAIRLAIDPQVILGVRGAGEQEIGQLSTSLIPGHNPEITRPETDVEAAKALLTEAGYEDGFELELTYFAPSEQTAQAYKEELAKAGITVNLNAETEIPSLVEKAIGGNTDLFFTTWSSDILDSSDTFTEYYVNSNNYQNEEINTLMEQVNATFDQAERIALLQQIARIAFEDVATVPMFSAGSVHLVVDPDFQVELDLPHHYGVDWWRVHTLATQE